MLLHAEGLNKRGHELRLILEPGSPIADAAARMGLSVELVCMRRSRYPSAILAFRRILTRMRPDVLQVNSSRDSWIGCLAARTVSPRPSIVRIRHISTPLNRNAATQLMYRRLVDMVIVTGGESSGRALVERDGLRPDRVASFPIGIDTGYFTPGPPDADLRAELGLPPGQRLVGLISFLRSYKGHEYFVDAAALVSAARKDATFLIVGQGPEEAAIRRRIESAGVAQSVRMLGYRDDLLNVFRSLNLFVIPSVEGDTIPQALMQALAMQLPVVSTTVGSIPDVVLEGETGFVVPPRDAKSLADRIVTLLDDPALRSRMGIKGRALVEGSYSLNRMLDKLEAVYTQLVRRR